MPSRALERARDSLKRLRQIDDELEAMRCRIGGQRGGIGSSIDHTTVLDPTRHLDDLIDSEPRLAEERRYCEDDIDEGWVIFSGLESLMDAEPMDEDLKELIKYVVCEYHLYGRGWAEIASSTSHGGIPDSQLCAAALRWLDDRGYAKVRSAAVEEGDE